MSNVIIMPRRSNRPLLDRDAVSQTDCQRVRAMLLAMADAASMPSGDPANLPWPPLSPAA
ncbi:MAG: hypothetical protein AAF416_05005 [Pseudomonadota bacterium]